MIPGIDLKLKKLTAAQQDKVNNPKLRSICPILDCTERHLNIKRHLMSNKHRLREDQVRKIIKKRPRNLLRLSRLHHELDAAS